MRRVLVFRMALVTFAAIGIAACTGGMHGDLTAGKQRLQSGIGLARSGIQQYQAGNTGEGIEAVNQGRGMMGQGMGMMGLGCCMSDGGVANVGDGGLVGGCASSMGPGGSMALQGLAEFDGARPMMTSADPATAGHAMADMESGMKMMEQGSSTMMNGEPMGMM